MKLNFRCPVCEKAFHDEIEAVMPLGHPPRQIYRPKHLVFDVTDKLFYETVCLQGHHVRVLHSQPKFEILFDLGACAIVDGYYREAVLSFAGSLERFYEFWLWTIWRHAGVSSAAITSSWKLMQGQSERQLGAFISAYTKTFHKTPIVMSDNRAKFRNGVVHKGKIPTRAEALEFGDYIISLIRPMTKELDEHCREAVDAMKQELGDLAIPDHVEKKDCERFSIVTVLRATYSEYADDNLPLEQRLDNIKGSWSNWNDMSSNKPFIVY